MICIQTVKEKGFPAVWPTKRNKNKGARLTAYDGHKKQIIIYNADAWDFIE